jgi:hemerythrin
MMRIAKLSMGMSMMEISLPLLPVAFMNEDHAHAETLWKAMRVALACYPTQIEPLASACRAFLEHNRDHFGREEAAMLQTSFPPYPVHKAEHDRVLAQLEELVTTADSGMADASLQRAIEQEIPSWLLQHVQSMDTITARWIAAHTP